MGFDQIFRVFTQHIWFLAFCWIAVFVAILIDLINGVQKAKKNKIARVSEGYRRTTAKLTLYFSGLTLSLFGDFIIDYAIDVYSNFIPVLPYFTIFVTIWFLFTEFISVREKADVKLQKSINKSGAELIKALSALKDKDIIGCLKNINVAEKADNEQLTNNE